MTQAYLFDFLEADARRRRLLLADGGPGAGGGATSLGPLEINPYRGCRFRCGSCRRRWERGGEGARLRECVLARRGTAAALGRALDSGRGRGRTLVIGARDDPYPEMEIDCGVTRAVWKELAGRGGWTILLRTRSPALRRDFQLLRQTACANRLRVEIPLATLDTGLLAALEPDAPAPDRRLRLLEDLNREGIAAGLSLSPLIPGVTDSLGELEDLIRTSRRHGARFVVWSPLTLRFDPGAEPGRADAGKVFLNRLRSFSPRLAERLEKTYGEGEQASPFRRRLIATRIRELKFKYRFPDPEETVRPGAGASRLGDPPGRERHSA